jgi:hypothetical protein
MNHIVTEKYLSIAKQDSTMRRAGMISTAKGETLDSEAEEAFYAYLTELQQQIKMLDAEDRKISATLRDVFLAGYRASEERRFR